MFTQKLEKQKFDKLMLKLAAKLGFEYWESNFADDSLPPTNSLVYKLRIALSENVKLREEVDDLKDEVKKLRRDIDRANGDQDLILEALGLEIIIENTRRIEKVTEEKK